MKYYYFFDINELQIERFHCKIARELERKEKVNNFIFFFIEKCFSDIPKNIPEGSKVYFLPNMSKRNLDKITSKYQPKCLITTGCRVPDMWLYLYMRKLGVPSFFVQHGLWSDELEHIPLYQVAYKKFNKLCLYSKFVYYLAKMNKLPFWGCMYDYYKSLFTYQINIPESKYLSGTDLKVDYVFSYDESWDDYYKQHFGYEKNQMIYIGNPDFNLLKGKDLVKKEDAVCYICQSFVEEVRLDPNKLDDFLGKLNKSLHGKKLYIKMHPMTDMKYYKSISAYENVEFTKDFPICKKYIGHYSSLLAVAKQVSDDVLIWNFPDHHLPPYFLRFGSILTGEQKELETFIHTDNYNHNLPSEHIIKLSQKQIDDFIPPMAVVANYISKL